MKNVLAKLFIIICLVQRLFFLIFSKNEILPTENRSIAAWPSKPRLTQNGITDFFADLNLYFTDRIILREQLIKLSAGLNSALGSQVDFDKVYFGKDGWLFLGDQYGQITSKLVGRVKPVQNGPTVRMIRRELGRFPGTDVIFLVGPNKHTVYPEYLPSYIHPTPERYVTPILNELRQLGLEVVDPSDDLRIKKNGYFLYYKTDTHWNLLGASIASELLVQHYNQLTGQEFKLPSYTLEPIASMKGDLDGMANLKGRQENRKDTFNLKWSGQPRQLETQEVGGKSSWIDPTRQIDLNHDGRAVIVRNPEAQLKQRVWFFHDSFGIALSPYIHSIFEEVWHFKKNAFSSKSKDMFHGHDFSKDGADLSLKPDLIIFELVERDIR